MITTMDLVALQNALNLARMYFVHCNCICCHATTLPILPIFFTGMTELRHFISYVVNLRKELDLRHEKGALCYACDGYPTLRNEPCSLAE